MMRLRLFAISGAAVMLTAGTNAFASVHLNVDINPFGWGAPPPVVYAPPGYYGRPGYYGPPPVVYVGGGQWGGHRGGRDRGHGGGRHR